MKRTTKMNLPYQIMLIILTSFIAAGTLAQTNTNIEKLHQIAAEHSITWDWNMAKVKEYCKQKNIPIRRELDNGKVILMVNVENGIPEYLITDNIGAAQTTRASELWPGGSTGFNITGSGYDKLGVWDAGSVRDTHVEFMNGEESRVTNVDEETETHEHSTHVAGTMIAAGVDADAKGMAFEAQLKSWDMVNHYTEVAIAAADGLEVSNHSYGPSAGWNWDGAAFVWVGDPEIDSLEDYKFGFYDDQTNAIDEILYNAPNYLIIASAGNHRGEGPANAGQDGNPEKDGGDDGYDCIPTTKTSKNMMIVGAVEEVPVYTGPADVIMTYFSSWGPTDDGRIKPDIVGKGWNLYSTINESDNSYSSMSGTSMSSPNVAGSAALLQYYYQTIFDNPMRSATLKGLIIHSADEAGPYDGPDYMFGWGLMNTGRAAQIITEDTSQNVISEYVLNDGNTYSITVATPGDTTFRVTICWTDLPGTTPAPQLNAREPLLVNDLDLRIVSNDTTFYPYSLDPENPLVEASTDGKNNVDNVEMVYVADAPAGVYNIVIDHDGSLEEGSQAYSLIISGIIDLPLPGCSEALLVPSNEEEDILLNQSITWTHSPYATKYNVYFGTDGGGVETPSNIYNGEIFEENNFLYLLDPCTTYYLMVVPKNDIGTAENCNEIWSFTTMESVIAYPFVDDFTEANPPNLPFGYQSYSNSEANWVSTSLLGYNDNYSMMCMHPQGEVIGFDNWLFTMPFSLRGEKEYIISFRYMNSVPGTAESISLYSTTNPNPAETDNIIFQQVNFDHSGWQLATTTYEPATDEVAFFGFRTTSNEGYGLFVDDLMVEGWSVGVNDKPTNDEIKIYSFGEKIFINGDKDWLGSHIKIFNLTGQIVYEGVYSGKLEINLVDQIDGLYVVRLENNESIVTKKIVKL